MGRQESEGKLPLGYGVHIIFEEPHQFKPLGRTGEAKEPTPKQSGGTAVQA